MKKQNFNKQEIRDLRHKRILKKIRRGNHHLRLRVTKTNAHIYLQAIDDVKQITIVSSSSLQLKLQNGNMQNTKLVVEDLLSKLKSKAIKQLVLDRGPYKFHGKIKEIATSLRDKGIVI